MNGIEAIALLITALVVPYVVALIKNKTLTGNKARWIAIGVSVLAGVVTAFVSGIPADPIAWITCIVAAIGAVQLAYSAFKSVGITCGWLDALQGIAKDSDDPLVAAKNQSMKDTAENAAKHAKKNN